MKPSVTTFSALELAEYFRVDRQTVYRWRNTGKLPKGILIGQRIRRWPLDQLINHSIELRVALKPLTSKYFVAQNDNHAK